MDRYAASLLASSHEAADLAVAFADRISEELRVCLVHELVLRGVAVGEIPEIGGWVREKNWSHHPLGWLPLELSDVELSADLPIHGARGSSHTMPYGTAESHELAVPADVNIPVADVSTEATVAGNGHSCGELGRRVLRSR
ncbi:DUF6183 family protein [Streptomyces sp. NPDC056534]|uniref:DUF6183 family protein n=1 Tax=Streptomyces sp. NPDC056534 TaxID=3345857 RepID=UPI0036A5AC4F